MNVRQPEAALPKTMSRVGLQNMFTFAAERQRQNYYSSNRHIFGMAFCMSNLAGTGRGLVAAPTVTLQETGELSILFINVS
jgi:hypothetical protein